MQRRAPAELASDLSCRAALFRAKLIEEFHIEETLGFDSQNAPKLSTSDLISSSDPIPFEQFLLNTPHELVKFKIFKRSLDQQGQDQKFKQKALPLRRFDSVGSAIAAGAVAGPPGPGGVAVTAATGRGRKRDARLARVAAQHSVPVAVWANWATNHRAFTGVIFFLIVSNAIMQGVQIQLNEEDNHVLYRVMDIYEDVTIVTFCVEILVKWLDSFQRFWKDGWNIFDFVVTILSVVPRVMSLFLVNDKGSSFNRLTRQLRLFRTLRILKMIARLGRLRVVVSTVLEAFQSLGFLIILLLLLTYMFSIFAINLFYPYSSALQEGLLYQEKFEDMSNSFMSLFQLLTLDQWYNIQEDIQRIVVPYIVVSFFIIWVWIGAFIFRNVFVGVVVRKFSEMTTRMEQVEAGRRVQMRHERVLARLNRELHEHDQSSGGDHQRDNGGLTTTQGSSMDGGRLSTRSMSQSSDVGAYAGAGEQEDVVRTIQRLAKEFSAAENTTPGLQPAKGDKKGAKKVSLKSRSHATARTYGIPVEPMQSAADIQRWQMLVTRTLEALHENKTEHIWPRAALYRYFQVMALLQNNMKEYQDLQYVCALAIHSLYDKKAARTSDSFEGTAVKPASAMLGSSNPSRRMSTIHASRAKKKAN